MIAHELNYDNDRQNVTDYLELIPKGKYLSILSSPKFIDDKNMLKLVKTFDIEIWILLIASYIIINSINWVGTKNWIQKFFIAFDYLVISMGKGILLNKAI